MNGKVDNPVEGNHLDNKLIFLTCHILAYALQRLDANDSALSGVALSFHNQYTINSVFCSSKTTLSYN